MVKRFDLAPLADAAGGELRVVHTGLRVTAARQASEVGRVMAGLAGAAFAPGAREKAHVVYPLHFVAANVALKGPPVVRPSGGRALRLRRLEPRSPRRDFFFRLRGGLREHPGDGAVCGLR